MLRSFRSDKRREHDPHLIGVILVSAAFVFWRYTSVRRGAEKRDALLLTRLDPIAAKFERKERVTPDEINALAKVPELRNMLYTLLSHYQRTDLFSTEYLSHQAEAEAALVHWMLHPNELQAAPSAIELVEVVQREAKGRQGEFFVFRYKMPNGHWAGPDWMLGLAGPLYADDKPYENIVGSFSRAGDVAGNVAPAELVDWYVGMMTKKVWRST
jgi:hypothetical protein